MAVQRYIPALALSIVALLTTRPLGAHDFWMQPSSFHVAPGQTASIRFLIGEAYAPEHWETEWRKAVTLQDFGPDGLTDRLSSLVPLDGATPTTDRVDATLTFSSSGTHMVAFTSNQLLNDLPPDKFLAYAKHEGLSLILADRAKKPAEAHGRELYSRRAKALIQVGNTPTDTVSRPIGQTLEIVPVKNPMELVIGEPLHLRILLHGSPLRGALVGLEQLSEGKTKETSRLSDEQGQVTFALATKGAWKINVVWSYPISDPRADYETIFSSLTFSTVDH